MNSATVCGRLPRFEGNVFAKNCSQRAGGFGRNRSRAVKLPERIPLRQSFEDEGPNGKLPVSVSYDTTLRAHTTCSGSGWKPGTSQSALGSAPLRLGALSLVYCRHDGLDRPCDTYRTCIDSLRRFRIERRALGQYRSKF